ncbi:MAG: hypothetical protein HOO96_31475, partial [Polyangiaceae bacterium]|nr:hypothetical protein [Polyangiaceae bacterium]
EGGYDSASSNNVVIRKNYVYRSAQFIGHPGILISGENAGAPPLDKLTLVDNVSAETVTGQAYRAEGKLGLVDNTGLSDNAATLPRPIPVRADAKARDTSILATRDTSWVETEAGRRGLHRIHVRNGANGFEQRLEYVVRGAPADVANFVQGCSVESRVVGGKAYALVVSPFPLSVPPSIEGVTFEQLRTGDVDGTLTWLWQRIDAKRY